VAGPTAPKRTWTNSISNGANFAALKSLKTGFSAGLLLITKRQGRSQTQSKPRMDANKKEPQIDADGRRLTSFGKMSLKAVRFDFLTALISFAGSETRLSVQGQESARLREPDEEPGFYLRKSASICGSSRFSVSYSRPFVSIRG
jgi:hypothetical protein